MLRKGPGGRSDVDYRKVCVISQSMRQAEPAWRKELAGRTPADIKATVERRAPGTPAATRELRLLRGHARPRGREVGVSARRVNAVAAWRDTPFFSDEERAALALAEAATRVPGNPGGVRMPCVDGRCPWLWVPRGCSLSPAI
ncbi:hypothetical protein [Nonomuraea sp. CA-141351]|uniref:hypothetical protein n=1 Tax=Nonomuraea sp. CA-141351 TaxID=3239996 RepID=UPI003D90B2E3